MIVQPVEHVRVFRIEHNHTVADHVLLPVDLYGLQVLQQLTLDVTGLCGLNGRIDNALTPRRSVEEELERVQPGEERVLDEPELVRVVDLTHVEMRQRAGVEVLVNHVVLDHLLRQAASHLDLVDN